MSNVIAVVWDFDKTLIPGYMETPVFNKYGVNESEFWAEVNRQEEFYKQQDVRINKDTIYLNLFLRYAKKGIFKGLNNALLQELGQQLKFYNGVIELLQDTREIVNENPQYDEYNIKVEHYIVSTGLRKMVQGSAIMPYVDGIWGCDFIEDEVDGEKIISEIGFTIDNTTKTRALFEINKGIPKDRDFDVNARVPEEQRRVQFKNMIYIADGPSDVPAFSVVNSFGGATFAIYPREDEKAFLQVEKLREDGRINMYAEADYSRGTTAYMWITGKIKEFANRIYEEEKQKLDSVVSKGPKHLV